MTKIIRELIPTKELGFGQYFCDQMITSEYLDGTWRPLKWVGADSFHLSPAAKCLHYAQEIFEGLKAFKKSSGETLLFRPHENIKRMSRSAQLMAMPPFPEDVFFKAIEQIVTKYQTMIPSQPGSLYLRPTMIGTGTSLGVAASTSYLFYIMASPVGGYFGDVVSEKPASVAVYISKKFTRAAPGGIGSAKTGGNYAASLRAIAEAKAEGYSNVLFLDAKERTYLEELGGMNVFVMTKDGLKTPPLGDTILAGVTRDSILKLAPELGIPVSETPISIHELIEGIKNKNVTEVFACGTAASITNIKELGFEGTRLKVGSGEPGPIATSLFLNLTQIQNGIKSAPHKDWCVKL